MACWIKLRVKSQSCDGVKKKNGFFRKMKTLWINGNFILKSRIGFYFNRNLN